MTGVIWVTQLTQYPSFAWFREGDFAENHDKYRVGIALIATPIMILEAVSGVLLIIYRPSVVGGVGAWAGLSLIVLIWASMFFLQVPQHSKLSRGFDSTAIKRLVMTNWVRTVAWTIRAGIVVLWMFESLRP